jgi:hypothetical protein
VIKEPYSTIIEKLLRLLKEKFGDDLISVAVYEALLVVIIEMIAI